MTLAQAWVTALLDIGRRPTESIDQKIPEPLLRGGQIVGRIHGAQQVVRGNLAIESRHQPLKSLITDNRVDLVLFH